MSKDATKKAALTALDVVRVFLASVWLSAMCGAFLSAAMWTKRHLDDIAKMMGW